MLLYIYLNIKVFFCSLNTRFLFFCLQSSRCIHSSTLETGETSFSVHRKIKNRKLHIIELSLNVSHENSYIELLNILITHRIFLYYSIREISCLCFTGCLLSVNSLWQLLLKKDVLFSSLTLHLVSSSIFFYRKSFIRT